MSLNKQYKANIKSLKALLKAGLYNEKDYDLFRDQARKAIINQYKMKVR
jgi:hypothetical protein